MNERKLTEWRWSTPPHSPQQRWYRTVTAHLSWTSHGAAEKPTRRKSEEALKRMETITMTLHILRQTQPPAWSYKNNNIYTLFIKDISQTMSQLVTTKYRNTHTHTHTHTHTIIVYVPPLVCALLAPPAVRSSH